MEKKTVLRRSLCVYCAVKFDDGFDMEEINEARFDQCDECGKKSIVKDFIIRKNKMADR